MNKYLSLILSLFSLFFVFGTQSVQAQLDNTTKNKIKIMYLTADNKYKEGDYNGALEKINDIEAAANGMRIPTAQNLKVKALVGAKNYPEAKKELDILQGLNLSDEIIADMANYSDKIENAVKALKVTPVKIGNQVWMDRNLNVSTFRNGDPIYHAKTKEEWIQAFVNQQPAWCYYENSFDNGLDHGKLYNDFAIMDPRGLAPEGWHVASNTEWNKLINYLGGKQAAARKLKTTSGWGRYNGTNEVNFNASHSKYRNSNGEFWNSTSKYTDINAYAGWRTRDRRFVHIHDDSFVDPYISFADERRGRGASVRCIKNVPRSEIVMMPDQRAQFTGGQEALVAYIQKKQYYPYQAKNKGIEGKVFVTFVIDQYGNVDDITIRKRGNIWLDNAALSLVSQMPTWIPAKHKGKNVSSELTLPVSYKLE